LSSPIFTEIAVNRKMEAMENEIDIKIEKADGDYPVVDVTFQIKEEPVEFVLELPEEDLETTPADPLLDHNYSLLSKSANERTADNQDEILECSKCEFTTASKQRLAEHKFCHNKRFQCTTCDRRFSRPCLLRHHEEQHHKDDYQQSTFCDDCQLVFLSFAYFKKHRRIVHKENVDGEFQCSKCPRSYHSNETLIRHSRNCYGHSKFSCDVCSASFENKHLIRKHLKKPCKKLGPFHQMSPFV